MIISIRNHAEKCYTELARSIGALQLKGQLSDREASSLLDILDLVVVQNDSELHRVLGEFLEFDGIPETNEIEEIVKATLIGTNLRSPEDLSQAATIIGDLTRERNRILDGQQGG